MQTNTSCLRVCLFALIAVALFSHLATQAQGVCGIFLTETDFRKGQAAFVSHGDTLCKIRLHLVFARKPIAVRCGQQQYTLAKDSVFGYKTRDGSCYRLYQHQTYTILNPNEEILLYRYCQPGAGKGEAPTVLYYFSKRGMPTLYKLTIGNLLRCFSDKARFCTLLEVRYRHDSELTEYDAFHHQYKLNRLLELSNTPHENMD